ncbi:MAG: hypothetical protein AB8C46_07530 [Burkholderiaceae bacterium]
MLIELIATLALGSAIAGVVLVLSRFTGHKLPRSFAPVAAGVAMIAFQVWSEYAWFGRTAGALPEGIEVTEQYAQAAPWRPWTYVFPQVNRFVAVDVAAARRHESQPGHVIADVFLFARFAPTVSVPQLVDCETSRRADLADGVQYGADGAVINPGWTNVPSDDPLLTALCPGSPVEPTVGLK